MVPQVVAYYSFAELLDDTKKLYEPWTVLRKKEAFLAVGSIDENLDVATKVIFNNSFIPAVKHYSLYSFHLINCITNKINLLYKYNNTEIIKHYYKS